MNLIWYYIQVFNVRKVRYILMYTWTRGDFLCTFDVKSWATFFWFLMVFGEQQFLDTFSLDLKSNILKIKFISRRIFVTQDCGETVTSIDTDFVPKHVEFDVKVEPRFLVHDRESANMTLFVTVNYGNSFQKVGEFIKNFFIYNTEVS